MLSDTQFSELLANRILRIKGWGVWRLLNRKQGKTFCGARNEYVEPVYNTRIKFTPDVVLKEKINK